MERLSKLVFSLCILSVCGHCSGAKSENSACTSATVDSPILSSELPEGRCHGKSKCTIETQDPCEGSDDPNQIVTWICSCTDSSWSCAVFSASKGGCRPVDPACPDSSQENPVSSSEVLRGECVGARVCRVYAQDPCNDSTGLGGIFEWNCVCSGMGNWLCGSTQLTEASCPASNLSSGGQGGAASSGAGGQSGGQSGTP